MKLITFLYIVARLRIRGTSEFHSYTRLHILALKDRKNKFLLLTLSNTLYKYTLLLSSHACSPLRDVTMYKQKPGSSVEYGEQGVLKSIMEQVIYRHEFFHTRYQFLFLNLRATSFLEKLIVP
jgi:hypothetical protein